MRFASKSSQNSPILQIFNAGWTIWTGDPTASYRRHDAAYFELPAGPALTLVVFTEGKEISADMTSLPFFARTAARLAMALRR